ncbi:MAG TPA: ATP-binding protein [Chloroflexia bacterium]|nr:ATP-binding protein [Chloroflexia bacterium]
MRALREAVTNALVHRDYSRQGESIRLFYFTDRIEVHSPGLLLPGITVEQMRQGIAPSKLRNPVIGSLLRDMPGYMERAGLGTRLMLHEMKQSGLPEPEFRELSEFVVTFWRAPRADSSSVSKDVPQPVTVLRQTQVEVTQPRVIIRTVLESQEKRFELALQLVKEYGKLRSGDYQKLTGVSEATATRDLETLVKRGALAAHGERRGRYYTLP